MSRPLVLSLFRFLLLFPCIVQKKPINRSSGKRDGRMRTGRTDRDKPARPWDHGLVCDWFSTVFSFFEIFDKAVNGRVKGEKSNHNATPWFGARAVIDINYDNRTSSCSRRATECVSSEAYNRKRLRPRFRVASCGWCLINDKTHQRKITKRRFGPVWFGTAYGLGRRGWYETVASTKLKKTHTHQYELKNLHVTFEANKIVGHILSAYQNNCFQRKRDGWEPSEVNRSPAASYIFNHKVGCVCERICVRAFWKTIHQINGY